MTDGRAASSSTTRAGLKTATTIVSHCARLWQQRNKADDYRCFLGELLRRDRSPAASYLPPQPGQPSVRYDAQQLAVAQLMLETRSWIQEWYRKRFTIGGEETRLTDVLTEWRLPESTTCQAFSP